MMEGRPARDPLGALFQSNIHSLRLSGFVDDCASQPFILKRHLWKHSAFHIFGSNPRHHATGTREQQKHTHQSKIHYPSRGSNQEGAPVTSREVESSGALVSAKGVPEPGERQDDSHKRAPAGRRRQRTRRYEKARHEARVGEPVHNAEDEEALQGCELRKGENTGRLQDRGYRP